MKVLGLSTRDDEKFIRDESTKQLPHAHNYADALRELQAENSELRDKINAIYAKYRHLDRAFQLIDPHDLTQDEVHRLAAKMWNDIKALNELTQQAQETSKTGSTPGGFRRARGLIDLHGEKPEMRGHARALEAENAALRAVTQRLLGFAAVTLEIQQHPELRAECLRLGLTIITASSSDAARENKNETEN